MLSSKRPLTLPYISEKVGLIMKRGENLSVFLYRNFAKELRL